jgi:hypothetical protein
MIWKRDGRGEALLTKFKVPYWNILGEIEEEQQKSQSG